MDESSQIIINAYLLCYEMNVAVLGMGYVGLPLALQAAKKNIQVIGVDVNEKLIDSLNRGIFTLNDDFASVLFFKTTVAYTTTVPAAQDAYIICVPTPVTKGKEPDLKYVIEATKAVAQVMPEDALVIIESTINPGVCGEIVKPILDASGKTYFLAHCPERINPGDPKWHVGNIPRVVGGIDEESTSRAKELYESILDASVTPVSQIEAAEATKILENTFRDVNIAFINEMAQSFHKLGINVSEVIKGAKTKPFGFMPHYPGLGVGGHCIAVDPYYMIEKGKSVGFEHTFLMQARKINSSMPRFFFEMIRDALNDQEKSLKGSRILILGVAYKPNIADDRESPSYVLKELLEEKSALVVMHDPHIEKYSTLDLSMELKRADCVVLATAHKEYLNSELYVDSNLVVDCRNIITTKLSCEYYSM